MGEPKVVGNRPVGILSAEKKKMAERKKNPRDAHQAVYNK
jgi:hypothetical protein